MYRRYYIGTFNPEESSSGVCQTTTKPPKGTSSSHDTFSGVRRKSPTAHDKEEFLFWRSGENKRQSKK